MLGAAFTSAGLEIKHNLFKGGDNTKLSSILLSIYGLQELNSSYFAQGIATIGVNDVRNRYSVVSASGYNIVNGKYTSMSFSSEAMVGYNYIMDQATLSPIAGLRYTTRINYVRYRESIPTNRQNFDVLSKPLNRLEIIIGARSVLNNMDFNGISLTPEIHGFINHTIIGKKSKQSNGMSGAGELATNNKAKFARTTYNFGLGLNTAYNTMEYGVSYDNIMAKKYTGHQGTLKVRLNF